MKRPFWSFIVALLVLTGCAVGPNYKRPQVAVPAEFRGPQSTSGSRPDSSLADIRWAELFGDTRPL